MADWFNDFRIRFLLARIEKLNVQVLLLLDLRDRLRARVDWLRGKVA